MTLAFLNIGTQEMILIVIVILLLFGGKKLPELARGLGRGIREFKDASEGIKREISDQINSFEKDLDVTVEEKPKSYTSTEEKVEQVTEETETKTDSEEEEVAAKKFPTFTAPENIFQHNPGGHPADDNDYYKYGYSDHFAEDDKPTEPTSNDVAAEKKTNDSKQD